MAIKGPTIEELAELAGRLNLRLTTADLESFRGLMEPMIASYSRLDEMVEPMPAIRADRSGYPVRGVESTGSSRRGGWCHIPARPRSSLHSTIWDRWRGAPPTARCYSK